MGIYGDDVAYTAGTPNNVISERGIVPYTVSGSPNIGSVSMAGLSSCTYTPSGCSMDYWASNTNCTSYEVYDYQNESTHYFGTVGNQSKLKINLYGGMLCQLIS